MPRFPRPCLKCSRITQAGETYCPIHLAEVSQARERKRSQDPARKAKKKLLYNSDYRKARQLIVEQVRQYGATCHICNQPINPFAQIDIDHLIPGLVNSPLLPTHPTCNRGRGNR